MVGPLFQIGPEAYTQDLGTFPKGAEDDQERKGMLGFHPRLLPLDPNSFSIELKQSEGFPSFWSLSPDGTFLT